MRIEAEILEQSRVYEISSLEVQLHFIKIVTALQLAYMYSLCHIRPTLPSTNHDLAKCQVSAVRQSVTNTIVAFNTKFRPYAY